MIIEAGFEIAFECPARTRLDAPSSSTSIPRAALTCFSADRISSDPPLGTRPISIISGNCVTRVEAPGGLVRILQSLRHS